MLVRESPDKLTLRADEVGTWKSCINVDHIAKERWAPPLVDADWDAFCQALYTGVEGEDWGEMYDSYKEMRRAVGVKKPQEAQKAKALWKITAAKDAGEKYYDPEREENIPERNKTRLALWEEHLKDPTVALDKALTCVENSCLRVLARILCGGSVLQWLVMASFQVCGRSRSVCLRTASTEWNVPGKYGPHGEPLFFFLIQKEPALAPVDETLCPFFTADIRTSPFSAEVLKKCALIALQFITEEGRGEEDGCHAPGLGDEWKVGCPESPMWENEGEVWSEDESVSSCGFREGYVCNDALHVIGLHGPGGKISFFLQEGEGCGERK